MVKIRLQRWGAKKSPFYRVVVATSTAPRDGRFIELLGTYHPLRCEESCRIKKERTSYWLDKGAQPTSTVAGLLLKEGILSPRTSPPLQQGKAPSKGI